MFFCCKYHKQKLKLGPGGGGVTIIYIDTHTHYMYIYAPNKYIILYVYIYIHTHPSFISITIFGGTHWVQISGEPETLQLKCGPQALSLGILPLKLQFQ